MLKCCTFIDILRWFFISISETYFHRANRFMTSLTHNAQLFMTGEKNKYNLRGAKEDNKGGE